MGGLSSKCLVAVLAGAVALSCADAAMARSKKHRAVRHHAAPAATYHVRVPGELSVPVDSDGTPIIMQGYRHTRPAKEPEQGKRRTVHIPRGSSTYIPPINPAPNAANSPPNPVLNQPVVQPYKPPPINTFSDRVTNCIHSFPLQGGVGNNPSDQQMYIRQCANQ